MSRPILLTGAAGFIGYHTAERLLSDGHTVVGVDDLNDHTDPALKRARLARLVDRLGFRFVRTDLTDAVAVARLFDEVRPARVCHLAAQVGVRRSLDRPATYVQSNVVGFANVLEACRAHAIEHLVYASSSSVYGVNPGAPSTEPEDTDHPISVYAATKKSNEVLAHAYASAFGLPCTGLRFFTVYGPWGRPDMAPYLFAKAIKDGRPIDVFNHGDMQRAFTYVDDVARAVLLALTTPPAHPVPYALYNVGNPTSEPLSKLVALLEQALGRTAMKHLLPLHPADVPSTRADPSAFERAFGFRPATPLEVGIPPFVNWFLEYDR